MQVQACHSKGTRSILMLWHFSADILMREERGSMHLYVYAIR